MLIALLATGCDKAADRPPPATTPPPSASPAPATTPPPATSPSFTTSPPPAFTPAPTATPAPTLPTQATAADLQVCVETTNQLRAQVGQTLATQSAALEVFAATSARDDAISGVPHSHFTSTNGGGVAFAENEVLRWPFGGADTVQDTIRHAIALFFGEGPGGPHYQNLTSYSMLGCGVYIDGRAITVVQDFR